MDAVQNKKLVIAGGTGFIGHAIARYFEKDNEVVLLTRNSNRPAPGKCRLVPWDARTLSGWVQELDGADLVINLAGENINCRHTTINRQKILRSRLDATKAIGRAIDQLVMPPACWINASAIAIYAEGWENPCDEYSRAFASSFPATVVKEWEAVFFEESTAITTRKLALRLGVVLGDGGAMEPYFRLAKFGLCGRQGNGKQMVSWIHAMDVCRIIAFLYSHQELDGVINACAPVAVTNKVFMKTIGQVCHAPFALPAKEWMVRAGAWMIGTEATMVLESRNVLSARLATHGFVFRFPQLTEALEQVVQNIPGNRYRLF